VETIRIYVENMFKTLPKTAELKKLKQDILMNMEEKYLELKSDGKTENEAVGIVISEFGNIDEIIKEFGIETNEINKYNGFPQVSLEGARSFLKDAKRCNFLVSIGVMLCMLGVSVLVSLFQLYEDGIIFKGLNEDKVNFIPVSILLVFVVIAVAIFIFSGNLMEKYKYIEKGLFNLESNAKMAIEVESESLKSKVTFGTIIGVALCILSPIAIFLGGMISEEGYVYGTTILILIIAVAVFLFINVSACNDGHKKLLKQEEYSEQSRKGDRVIGAVASVVWPLATIVFFIWGFFFNGWGISWIVFPVVGILFGIFCSAYKSLKGIEE
jgi:MFS family permease